MYCKNFMNKNNTILIPSETIITTFKVIKNAIKRTNMVINIGGAHLSYIILSNLQNKF